MSSYRTRYRLPVYTSIASALKVLVSKGLVESSRRTHLVADPFLAEWLREPVYRIAT